MTDTPMTRDELREKVRRELSLMAKGRQHLEDTEDAILSIISSAGLPVEPSEEAFKEYQRAFNEQKKLRYENRFNPKQGAWTESAEQVALRAAYAIDARPVQANSTRLEALEAVAEAAKVIMGRYKEGGWMYDTATLEDQIKETDALDDALAALEEKK